MPLTNLICKNTKASEKPRKLSDGGGLYLEIMPNGAKYWRMKYRFNDKEKRLAFGVYPDVTLEQAREGRRRAKQLLSECKDPADIKKQDKLIAKVTYENTFENIAREWHNGKKALWVPSHATRILNRMEKDVFPKIGSRPISDITAPELLSVIRQIESREANDLAKRVLQNCGQVFRYAVASGRAERDPTGDLRGALKAVKHKHHAFIKADELPEYLAKLEAYDGNILTQLALKFLLLTFVRSGELRGAQWKEISFDKAEWRIPAERMKMKAMHVVPLCSQALAILRQVQQYSGNREHVFPNQHHPRGCMSENTLLYALYRMGYHSKATAHGFRSTASTILNEHGFRVDVIEHQLAHTPRNQVRAAYNHAEYLLERKEMMQWWGDYIDGKTQTTKVIKGQLLEMSHEAKG